MSNDKVAATFGPGQIVHWPVGLTKTACGLEREGDVLLRDGLPINLASRKIQVTCEQCSAALQIVFAQQYSSGSARLADTRIDEATAQEMVANFAQQYPHLLPGESSTGEHVWGKLQDDPYTPTPRSWMPTKSELALAMGIVAFIILLFAFVASSYR